jgi:hypothetical protein
MAKRRQTAQARQDQFSKGRQFTAEVILWAGRWCLMFPVSYRDLGFCEQSRQRWRYWQADVVIDMVTTV